MSFLISLYEKMHEWCNNYVYLIPSNKKIFILAINTLNYLHERAVVIVFGKAPSAAFC